jgi:anti-sigma factor RsiW
MMNCESFQSGLHEYLDEALDSGTRAEARLHLQQCSACQRAFDRECAMANVLRQSLSNAAAGLSVDPRMRQDILHALEANPSSADSWLAALKASTLFRPVLAAAAVLGVGILLIEGAVHRYAAKAVIQRQHGFSSAWVVDVPIQTQRHVFQRQTGTVVDSITEEMNGAHAGLPMDVSAKYPTPFPTHL